jgi:hypothetical protein
VLVLVVVLVLEIADISPLEQRNKIVGENRALLEARKSAESRTSTSTSTRTIPKFRDLGLARLERSSSGDFGYEAGGALGAGGGQRSKDLPGSRAFLGFVTTGDLACDDRRAQVRSARLLVASTPS